MSPKVGQWFADLRDSAEIWWSARVCTEPLRGFRRRLADYVFAGLPPTERREIEYHLDQCHRCSLEVERLRLVRARVRMLARDYRALLEEGRSPAEESARVLLAEAYRQERQDSRERFEREPALEDRIIREALRISPVEQDRPRRAAWTLQMSWFPRPAVVVGTVVAVACVSLWLGSRYLGRPPQVVEAPAEDVLVEAAVDLVNGLLLTEPRVDLRTSFGPELLAVVEVLRQQGHEPPRAADVERIEGLLEVSLHSSEPSARLASAAALISAFRRNSPSARDLMDRALALARPDDAETLLDAGVVALLAREFGQAEVFFTRALSIDPTLEEAQYNLARLYEINGQTDRARVAWQKYADMDSSSHWAELAETRSAEPVDKARVIGDWPPWAED